VFSTIGAIGFIKKSRRGILAMLEEKESMTEITLDRKY
jgi:hypothetical protein